MAYDATTRTSSYTFTIPAGATVPVIGTANANPDVAFYWRDGITINGRITNKVVVTGITGGTLIQPLPVDSSVVKDVGGGNGIY